MLTVTLVPGLLLLVLLVLGSLKETLVHTVVLMVTKEVAALHLLCSLVAVVTLDLPKVVSAGVTGVAAAWSLLLLGPDKY